MHVASPYETTNTSHQCKLHISQQVRFYRNFVKKFHLLAVGLKPITIRLLAIPLIDHFGPIGSRSHKYITIVNSYITKSLHIQ